MSNIYYYEKERIGDRVVSRYIASGEMALYCHILAKDKKEEREYKREQQRHEREEYEAVEKQINEVCEMIEILCTASLLANGWHQHKRQWRRKRNV